jgi:succinylglutamate desuccinylase
MTFRFNHQATDIFFNDDLDEFNFREVSAGITLGAITANAPVKLIATYEQGLEVTDDYFDNVGRRPTIKRTVIRSMLTLDENIIRKECLSYLMERLTLDSVD